MNEFIELPVSGDPVIINVAHIATVEKRGEDRFIVVYSPETYFMCYGSYEKFIQRLKVITCER